MQHDYVLKKLNFDILTPYPRVLGDLNNSAGKICYHVAAFVVLFNLICNMTMLCKKWILTSLPHPQGRGGGSAGNHVAAFMIFFYLICNITMFWKKLNCDLLTPSPGSLGSVGNQSATTLLHSWFSLIRYATNPCSKKVKFWPTDRRVGGGGRGSAGYHVAAFVILYSLIYNITMFWKVELWPTDPIPRVEGGSVCKISATMLLHSWFSVIWYATWPCSETAEFWPTDPIPRVGVCLWGSAGNHVAAFVILFNLICNMTMLWKGWILTYWPHPQGRGGAVGKINCYHVVVFLVLFDLICNMTMFWKSWILT